MQVINAVQRTILGIFGEAADSDQFYLTGGTALSHFYLQHRQSNDLDFFTPVGEIILAFSRGLEEKLLERGITVERLRGLRSFVELVARQEGGTTLIHLAQDAAFRFEEPRGFPEFPGLRVDSLKDIASNKVLALFGRATLRDFVDVYFLVKKAGFRREDLMDQAKKKDPGFDPYWWGVALEQIKTFPEDAPELLMLTEPVPFKKLVEFFNEWRQQASRSLRP